MNKTVYYCDFCEGEIKQPGLAVSIPGDSRPVFFGQVNDWLHMPSNALFCGLDHYKKYIDAWYKVAKQKMDRHIEAMNNDE